jgi:hypothetical protein
MEFVCLFFFFTGFRTLVYSAAVQDNLEVCFMCLFTFIGNDPEKCYREIDFDFLVCGEVLRVPLSDHLEEHSISTEVTADVEYFERVPAPEPQDCLLHDDWVSAVQVKDGW